MTDPTTPPTPEPGSTPPAAATPPAATPPAYTPAQAPGQPAYAAQPAYGAAPAKYNTLSIVGFILAFVVSIAGLIVSIIAYRQVGQTGEQGKGLALAGIIIGAIGVFFGIIWIIFLIIAAVASASYSSY